MKIARKISLSFLAAALGLTLVAGAFVYLHVEKDLKRTIHNHLIAVVDSRVSHLETYLEMLKISVAQLSKSALLESFLKIKDAENLQGKETAALVIKRLVKTRSVNPAVAEFLLMDRSGHVVAASNEKSIGQDKSSDSLFLGGQKGTFIKDLYFSEVYNEPLLGVSAPFLDSQTGELLGVLAARVRAYDLEQIAVLRTGLGETGEIFLINKYGYMITSSRFEEGAPLKRKVGAEAACVYCHATRVNQEGKIWLGQAGKEAFSRHTMAYVFPDYRGVPVLGAYRYIPEMEWGVLAEIHEKEALEPLERIRRVFLIILFFVALVGWGLGVVIAGFITKSLHRLHVGTEIIGRGDLDYKVGTDAKDEVGQLSREFDVMTENLKNKTTSVENLAREVTARKRTEDLLHESDKRFMDVLYASKDAILLIDEDKFVDCNDATARMLGYATRKEFLMTHPSELSPPQQPDGRESFEKANEMMKRAFAEGFHRFEWIHQKANGEDFPVEVSLTPISLHGRNILHCLWRDLTDVKKMEKALDQSERMLSGVVTAVPMGIGVATNRTIKWLNEYFIALFGYSEEEIIGKDARMMYGSDEEYQRVGKEFYSKLRAKEIAVMESSWRRKDGKAFDILLTGSSLVPGDPSQGIVFAGMDITQRKRAEEMILESEERHRALFEGAGDAIMTLTPPSWKFTSGNPAAIKMFKTKNEEEFISQGPGDLSPACQPDGRASSEKAKEMIETAMREGSFFFEWTHKRMRGEDFPATVLLTRMEIKGEMLIQATVRDISERKIAESKIHQLSQAVEQSPNCVVITDKAGKIEYVNKKFTELTGYSSDEAVGQNPRILKSGETPSEQYKDLWDTILSGKEWRGQFVNKKKNGDLYWEFATIAPIREGQGGITHFLALKEDITYRRQIEEQLRHSLRMESVGRLAGGIAHDFNNMLTVINGYSGYLVGKMKPEDPYYDKIREIRDAGDCAATIVRQLLNLSRKEAPKPQLIQVSEAVLKMERMITRLLGDSVELKESHASGPYFVKMDPGQMEQVLLNLLVNAREAMPEGGVLTVATDLVRIEEIQEELRPSQKRAGDFVRITVQDTGVGIDPSLRARIFEPFFTTKKKGMNTGLGLSIVYGIVEQAGGAVSLESQLGKGTIFRIYLPKFQDDAGLQKRLTPEALPQGRGKILLVEDESKIREFALQVLRERGYDVRVARGGEEALAMLAEDPGRKYELLLTDLTMPKMNGKELVTRVRKMIPGLKVIFMSGYSEQTVADVDGADFLQKPFSHGELSMKVWSVLGR